MNHYTKLLYFLKELAESHPLVNTVTHGNPDNIDLEKSNIFPLVHLDIQEAQFGNGKTLIFPITIECLTERDINKEIIEDKFWKQDNQVDNHNETLAILNFMWTSIYRDWNNENMTTSDNAPAEKIEFAKGNILDGWSLSFDVEVPNTELCLTDLDDKTYEQLVISIEGDGVTSPGAGTYSIESGTIQQLIAAPNSGNEFVKWTINAVDTTDAVVNLLMDGAKTAQAFFQQASSILQYFLKSGQSIFENEELKDYSNIPVNASLWGRGIYQPVASTQQYNLNDAIIVDLTQDGVHFEFVGSIASGTDRTAFFGDNSQTTATVRMMTNGIRVYYATTDDVVRNIFFSEIIPIETYKRVRLSTLNNILKCEITTPDDFDYNNANEYIYDLSLATNIEPYNINVIGGIVPSLSGGLVYGNFGGHIFNFAFGEDARYLFASNTDNYMDTENMQQYSLYQNEFITEKDGYSVIYTFRSGSNTKNWQIIPYHNGQSNAANISTRLTTDGVNHVIEEYPNGEFFNAWGFKIDASFEPFDQDNTYFDVGSNANIITENKQPTKLNNRVYYDRKNNADIQLFDTDTSLENSINTVNKKWLCLGDSTADAAWPEYLEFKSGMIRTTESYGGKTTAGVLTDLQAAVALTPTLVSDKDFITSITGFNDYSQNVSEIDFTTALDNLIAYLLSENPTATIILIGLYNFGNPIDDGTTPNSNGLTMDKIREIVQQKATDNNLYYSNWNDANILPVDIPDNLHTYTSTGGLKLCNQVLSTLNDITE